MDENQDKESRGAFGKAWEAQKQKEQQASTEQDGAEQAPEREVRPPRTEAKDDGDRRVRPQRTDAEQSRPRPARNERTFTRKESTERPPRKPAGAERTGLKPVKKQHIKPPAKSKLHPRNPHNGPYDLDKLVAAVPELAEYLTQNVRGEKTVMFAEPQAVLLLNKALILTHYDIKYWEIPEGFLCPPVPGRADYIHYMADVLAGSNFGNLPEGKKVTCLDIGVGANCIYPIIGTHAYGWNFIASDCDTRAKKGAIEIVDNNKRLKGKVEVKLQPNMKDILYGIIDHSSKIDLMVCNPPFHASRAAAKESSLRKQSNLQKKTVEQSVLNFGGMGGELWCEGGERRFVSDLIRESKKFADSVFWFSTLVSKQSNLKAYEDALDYNKATEIRVIAMSQGNKSSRILTWTFFDAEQKKAWREERWGK